MGFGDDLLIGGAGADTLTIGRDTDTIRNFEDGIDLFDLTDGLTFGQLSIADIGDNAEISVTATSDIIGIVENTLASAITAADFV